MNIKKMESHLRVNLLGPGPRLIKKNLPGRGLTKVQEHCCRRHYGKQSNIYVLKRNLDSFVTTVAALRVRRISVRFLVGMKL